MKITVKTAEVGALSARLNGLSKALPARLEQVCAALAEDITETAKGLVYQNGLTYQDGAIRDSLHGFTKRDGATVSFGVKTGLDIAVYHEMGTGPVGTEAGYPGESGLDQPVARRSTGWVYWSDEVYQQRLSGLYDSAGTYTVLPDEVNGFVYTRGVPPKAFLHNAVVQNREDAVQALARAAKEALGG